MDWETLYCPNSRCEHYGKPFKIGRLVRNGSSRGEPQARCQGCGSSVTWSYGTAYYGLGTDPLIFETALRALAEGNSLRATARIVEVDQELVRGWLDRAARPCRAVMRYRWRALPATEGQLDELWSFVHTQQDHLPGAQHYVDSPGETWVWLALAPVWRWVLGLVVGQRDQASANRWLGPVAQVTDARLLPLVTSARWAAYPQALLTTSGEWYRPPRRGTRGAHPQPRLRPRADLWYAPVIQQRRRGRVIALRTPVVFGDSAVVTARLAQSPVSQTLNTRFVEPDHLTRRQPNRRLTRQSDGISRSPGLRGGVGMKGELRWFLFSRHDQPT